MSNQQPSCAGNAAASFTTNIRTGMDAGATITVSWTNVRPGCEQQTVAVAGYDTAYDHFEAAEIQALIAATNPTPLGRGGELTWTVPDGTHPNCHVQLDVVTGPVHPVIDSGHRYNKPYFGLPGGNDLVTAGYAHDTDCTPPLPPATTAPAPTTTQPAPPAPPIKETFSDPLPPEMTTTTLPSADPTTSTTQPVDEGSPDPTPPGPGDPTLYTAQCVTADGVPCNVPTLPRTGASTIDLAAVGLCVVLLGVVTRRAAARKLARS